MKLNLGCLIHYMLLLICAAPVYAQTNASNPKSKNEIGLVIGAAELPSIGLADQGAIRFNSSLAFGAEYDRHLLGQSSGISAGIDFVASPFDVKASYPASNVSPEYAYLFLSPHVKLKFNQGAPLGRGFCLAEDTETLAPRSLGTAGSRWREPATQRLLSLVGD